MILVKRKLLGVAVVDTAVWSNCEGRVSKMQNRDASREFSEIEIFGYLDMWAQEEVMVVDTVNRF